MVALSLEDSDWNFDEWRLYVSQLPRELTRAGSHFVNEI